jgi:hypothetical protein
MPEHFDEIPSDEEVVKALQKLGGNVDAETLLSALANGDKQSRYNAQLAIQRAFDRRRIDLTRDWHFVAAAA